MIELVTVGDRKFEITQKIRIPSKADAEKLNKALEGMVYLRKNDDPQSIYLINEVIDAKFQDTVIFDAKSEPVEIETEQKPADSVTEVTGSETPKMA